MGDLFGSCTEALHAAFRGLGGDLGANHIVLFFSASFVRRSVLAKA